MQRQKRPREDFEKVSMWSSRFVVRVLLEVRLLGLRAQPCGESVGCGVPLDRKPVFYLVAS